MQLVSPTTTYQAMYLQALKEGKNETQNTRLEPPRAKETFADFVQRLNDYAKGLQLPEGWVPSTELWLIDNDEFIGRVSVRHILNDYLLKVSGHIGYYIRPTKRNLGYGKKILELALEEAKKLGIPKVLVTCDESNIGSQKIIEANGGILENTIETEKDKPRTKRYWIEL